MIPHRAAKARAIAKRLNDLANSRSAQLTAQEARTDGLKVRDVVADSISDLADIVLDLCQAIEPYE